MQTTGGSKAVPYSDSLVTHFFRNYFKGEGKVKMVVCVKCQPKAHAHRLRWMRMWT